MWAINTQAQMDAIEAEHALVGVYLDRAYEYERISTIMSMRRGFDAHALDAWHLLIPMSNRAYGVNVPLSPEEYGVELAAAFIDKLGIGFGDLPCIAFRAQDDKMFYLKLGRMSREDALNEIGLIADVARTCQVEQAAGAGFRREVNKRVAAHLRGRKLLSAAKSAAPAVAALLGAAVDIGELV